MWILFETMTFVIAQKYFQTKKLLQIIVYHKEKIEISEETWHS